MSTYFTANSSVWCISTTTSFILSHLCKIKEEKLLMVKGNTRQRLLGAVLFHIVLISLEEHISTDYFTKLNKQIHTVHRLKINDRFLFFLLSGLKNVIL